MKRKELGIKILELLGKTKIDKIKGVGVKREREKENTKWI